MAKSIPALITPSVLRWARESIGMDLEAVATRAKLDPRKLEAAETGEGHLTMAQLGKLATWYKQPLAVFFLPAPPRETKVVRDFRRLPGAPNVPSPELTAETRKVGARREIVLELTQELGDEPSKFDLTARRSEDPAAVASGIRQALGIDVATQRSWKTEADALSAWRTAVEAHGALVFQFSGVDVRETRGFSIYYDPLPVIAINSRDATTARIFSLMHELGHLLLRDGAACDMAEHERQPVEAWCNRFAAELLAPADEVRLAVGEPPDAGEWSDRQISSLARRFWVSKVSAVLRLVALGLASQRFYREWKSHQDTTPSSGGRADPPRQVLSRGGRTYVSVVLEAYHSDKISASTLSSYLGAKLEHLPKIEELVVGGRS